jgi:CubicO group peptidase (beta-lactamase class C family)
MSGNQHALLIHRREAIRRAGVTVAAATLGASSSAAGQGTDPDFARLLRLTNVPSFSYAIVDGDRITTSAVGIRRTGTADQATADTVYAAASLTKAVFAYLFLGLVNEGALSLDRPVGELLQLPHPADERSRAITARHLLSHSGGWRNWRNNTNQPLTADFTPGSRWSYSGEGFFFLQRIIEKITGRSVSQLARERVFDPLGMKRSSLAALAELEPFQAAGHNVRGDPTAQFGLAVQQELRRLMASRGKSMEAATTEDSGQALRTGDPNLPVLPNFMAPNAAASMLTTAADFGAFLKHLVTAPKTGGAPAAIVRSMMTPQIRGNEAIQWGLGVGLEDNAGSTSAWQWGDNPGFKNFFSANPTTGRAMVIFTNGDRGARVYERVIRAVTGADRAAFLFL